MSIEVFEIDINKIKPSKDNPKNHSKEQINKISESIKKFGFKVPLLIDGDNEIIAGEGRFLAAKNLQIRKIPCIYIKGLSKMEIKAFMVADNKVAESEWNEEKLAKIFNIIEKEDKELLHIIGFSENERKSIQADFDYKDLSKELTNLQSEEMNAIMWSAKFKNQAEFDKIKKTLRQVRIKNKLGGFKSEYCNGRVLDELCKEWEEDNSKVLKKLCENHERKTKS